MANSNNKNTSNSSALKTIAVVTSKPGKTADQVLVTPPDPLNIAYMVKEQREKHLDKYLRFKMVMPDGSSFQAHIDPNDFTRQQAKRIVQLDVLSGVVIQDFGFKPEVLEIKGTTGSRYWAAFEEMDAVFNYQYNGTPVPIKLYIERNTYTGVWTNFNANRTINSQAGNLVQYSMQFIVFSRTAGDTTKDSVAAGASVVQKNATSNQSKSSNGQLVLDYVPWTGKTINSYIQSNPLLIQQPDNVLNFIQQYWSNYTSNGAYPGPNKGLTSKQLIVVPKDWNSYLSQFQVAVNQ